MAFEHLVERLYYNKPDSKLFSNKTISNPTNINSGQNVFLIFRRYALSSPDKVTNEISSWYLRRLAEKKMDSIITGISHISNIVFFLISMVFSDNFESPVINPIISRTRTMALKIRKAGSRNGAGSKESIKKRRYSFALIIHSSNQK